MTTTQLKLFADYYQFYLQDESAEGILSDSWTDEATNRLLAIATDTIGVGTARNMDVPVTVEILEAEPLLDMAGWDHVAQCSIQVNSGTLVIAGCTDYFPDAKRITVTPGTYAARISYGALGSLSADGLDGNDHYRVQIWPSSAAPPEVLKQRAQQ